MSTFAQKPVGAEFACPNASTNRAIDVFEAVSKWQLTIKK